MNEGEYAAISLRPMRSLQRMTSWRLLLRREDRQGFRVGLISPSLFLGCAAHDCCHWGCHEAAYSRVKVPSWQRDFSSLSSLNEECLIRTHGYAETGDQRRAHRSPWPSSRHKCQKYVAQMFSNSQWLLFNIYKDIATILMIGGIETNPGPTMIKHLNVAHVNINSITAGHKIDELQQFVHINDIKIMCTNGDKT